MHVSLNDGWTLRSVGGDVPANIAGIDIPATVPGCVHLDLLAAQLIPDPYLDQNEAAVAWVGRTDWQYTNIFDVDGAGSHDQIDLVALGLDTIATVELNGSVVATTENMHRSYRIPVAELLKPSRNELRVTFAAGLPAAERMSRELGPRPNVNTHPYNAIRKMACNYGWDWGPDLVTAGIWRPLSMHSWTVARIAEVRPQADVDGATGVLRTHVQVQRAAGCDEPLTVEVQVNGIATRLVIGPQQTDTVVETRVDDVELWWPDGYGKQPLYPVGVLLSTSDASLDDWQGKVGFRTVELDTTPDEHGTPFRISVNKVPVFARGVNWIPDDCFPSRVTPNRYRQRLTQALDAHCNLVRVWGGGIYESDDFYSICDELGLLVWQDFLFACAAYAEEEPLRGEVIAEAREAVARIGPHPSLVLWNGGNENIWGYQDWGWKEPLAGRSWGLGYYTELLPSIVAELDPSTPYSPGSPYSMTPDRHPNDPAHGTMHIWDVWNQRDYTCYRDYRPRFCAEFGFQGPPTWSTLTRAIHDRPLAPDSPGMLSHQKADDGNGKLARGLLTHLPPPASFEDWHWATSLNQARAVAFGIEHFRSLAPDCMGSVVWQLNDCWPVTSWSAIDGDGHRKPLWYALRRSYRDRLLTIQPRDGGLAVVVVNDSAECWSPTIEVSRHRFDGSTLATTVIQVQVEPRVVASCLLPIDLVTADDPAGELIVAETAGGRAWWHFAEDVDASLPPAELTTTVDAISGGYRLTVTAGSLVRDLALLADRLDPDAVVDDMLISLLPGDQAVFEVATSALVDPSEFTDPAVLRSANQLLHPSPVVLAPARVI
ncbi:MAG: glycoside hydrolase family 2 protein [Nakamurella sp.]